MQIIDEVFADYQAQGKLMPAWRWELADASVYPQRSLCLQYHKSDLAFVQRLLAEEGLFCWFEHKASEGDALGEHTLVIADHNGCFQPNLQPRVRYTQSASASFKEDSLTQFHETRHVAPTTLAAASWDCRDDYGCGRKNACPYIESHSGNDWRASSTVGRDDTEWAGRAAGAAAGQLGFGRTVYRRGWCARGRVNAQFITGGVAIVLVTLTILIELFKDNKLQDWLERTLWGIEGDKYGSRETEMKQLEAPSLVD
jgi:hypothetical protein